MPGRPAQRIGDGGPDDQHIARIDHLAPVSLLRIGFAAHAAGAQPVEIGAGPVEQAAFGADDGKRHDLRVERQCGFEDFGAVADLVERETEPNGGREDVADVVGEREDPRLCQVEQDVHEGMPADDDGSCDGQGEYEPDAGGHPKCQAQQYLRIRSEIRL